MTTAAQLAQMAAPGVSLGFKNRIINGGMTIDQRNAGASVTPATDTEYTLDRWLIRNYGGSGRFSVQQVASSASGFTNAAKLTVTTTEAPGTYGYAFSQRIEGFNFADLGFGTASAQAMTISFWVQSSVTGTYCVSARNAGATRSYIAEFSINSANTYEYKTITIPGETSGTWSTTNTVGVYLEWSLGSQTGKQSTAGSWLTGNYVSTSNQVAWINNSGATFYITGVQLEVGTSATSFEFRDYGRELIMCQRYYWKWPGTEQYMVSTFIDGTSKYNFFVAFPVIMRTNPTATTSTMNYRNGSTYTDGSVTASGNYPNGSYIQYYGPSAPNTWGTSLPCFITTGWSWSAEL